MSKRKNSTRSMLSSAAGGIGGGGGKPEESSRRTLDYLGLLGLLLLFTVGGLVTMNCDPAESIPGGTLQEKEGVSKHPNGGVIFDSAVNNDSADYELPSTIEIGIDEKVPIQWSVDPVHQGRASVSSNMATINYPQKAEQVILFQGTYVDRSGTTRHVYHRVEVARY